MGREKAARSPSSVSLSGTLRDALPNHAKQRCLHFFSFLFYLQALVDYLNNNKGKNRDYIKAIKIHATDQIDTGFRVPDGQGIGSFDENDANVINLPCTAFGRTDAAHFCNLGIDRNFKNEVAQFSNQDEIVLSLIERLKKFAGDTRQLPQRVNIGPDRVIDQLHGRLAVEFIENFKQNSANKIISSSNIGSYFSEAAKDIMEYSAACQKAKKHGVAASADLYLLYYEGKADQQTKAEILIETPNKKSKPNPVPPVQDILASLRGGIAGECWALSGKIGYEWNYLSQ